MRSLNYLPWILSGAISTYAQIPVELYFKNSCNDSIEKLEFSLNEIATDEYPVLSTGNKATVPRTGKYWLSTGIWTGDKLGHFSQIIEIGDTRTFIDTVLIPRVKFSSDGAIHSRYWAYFNCTKLCDGQEIDYYPNGAKRLEGNFSSGKPSYIVEYREDGTKETEYLYIPGTMDFERVNHFDERGILDEYDKYVHRKSKSIRNTYSKDGKRIERVVTKYTIEKNF